jgi:hypothetical protein
MDYICPAEGFYIFGLSSCFRDVIQIQFCKDGCRFTSFSVMFLYSYTNSCGLAYGLFASLVAFGGFFASALLKSIIKRRILILWVSSTSDCSLFSIAVFIDRLQWFNSNHLLISTLNVYVYEYTNVYKLLYPYTCIHINMYTSIYVTIISIFIHPWLVSSSLHIIGHGGLMDRMDCQLLMFSIYRSIWYSANPLFILFGFFVYTKSIICMYLSK